MEPGLDLLDGLEGMVALLDLGVLRPATASPLPSTRRRFWYIEPFSAALVLLENVEPNSDCDFDVVDDLVDGSEDGLVPRLCNNAFSLRFWFMASLSAVESPSSDSRAPEVTTLRLR